MKGGNMGHLWDEVFSAFWHGKNVLTEDISF